MTDYPPGAIYDLADQFRDQLLRRERAAATQMVRQYGQVWRGLNERIADLVAQYNATGGLRTSGVWISQFERLIALRRQVEAELIQFSQFAEQSILDQQRVAIAMALQHAEQLTLASMGPLPAGISLEQAAIYAGYNRLPVEAFTNLIGFLQDGSPLRALLNELPHAGGLIVQDGLIQGLTLGQGAREIARNIRAGLGGNLARALTIARTETLRPYREASRQSYLANSQLINGWIWRSARNERTCGACWAMDGTEHTLDERLDDHPSGRCFMVPKGKTWAELGFDVPETVVEKEPGTSAFGKLSDADKLAVLGPAKYRAYQAGAISLDDLVGRRYDPRWGSMRVERSLKDVLGVEAIDYYKVRTPVQLPISSALFREYNSLQILGDNLIVTGFQNPKVKMILDQLSMIPRDILTLLKDANVKFYIGEGSVPDFDNLVHLREVHPRGWGDQTWANVPGCYDKDQKYVIWGTKGSHGSISGILHETGHAVDALADYSRSSGFLQLIEDNKKRIITPYYKQESPYANAEEIFAESFAHRIMNLPDRELHPFIIFMGRIL